MTDDATDPPAEVHATGDGATAISAGAGATVNVDNRIGVLIRDSQTGDVTINLPPPPTGLAALRQLRAPVADFVGREREVAALLEALAGGAAAISGVVGLGGIGKTELAMVVASQVIERFPDAQLVVELQGSREPSLPADEALRRVIRAFHPDAKLPDDSAQLGALYRSVLTGKRVLIVADDARDAAQVRPLLPPEGSALLVTSRQRFALPGMARVDLERLAEGEAVALLRTVCGRLSAEEAAQIAAACGGLPLALRVAGGLLASDETMSVARYLARLGDERRRLAALHDDSAPDLDVEASLALSYALLGAAAQADLRRLGVFGASFDLAAAGAVLAEGDEEAVEARLGALYRRCLLEFAPERRRYELHELVRVFALGQLGEGDEGRGARLRHARYYIAVADRADKLYLAGGENVVAGLALFDQERAGLDTARGWLQRQAGDAECDALLIEDANATVYIGELRYDKQHERIPQVEAALAVARRLGQRKAEGSFLNHLGLAHFKLGNYPTAIKYHQQALVIAREIGSRGGEGTALGNLGHAYTFLGDYPRAIEHYQQCLAVARELGDRRDEGIALGSLGLVYASLGDYPKAIEYHKQHLAIARQLGDRLGEGIALGSLGNAYHSLGKYPKAIEHYQQHLAIARQLDDRLGEGQALNNLGNAFASLGDYATAIEYYQQSLAIAHHLGDHLGKSQALGSLGNVYHSFGDYRKAIEHHQQHLAIAYQLNDRHGEGTALGNLGNAYYSLNDYPRATEHYQQHLAIARQLGERQGEAISSWNLGLVLVKQGDPAQALPYLEAVLAFYQALNHPSVERRARYVEQIRQQAAGTKAEG